MEFNGDFHDYQSVMFPALVQFVADLSSERNKYDGLVFGTNPGDPIFEPLQAPVSPFKTEAELDAMTQAQQDKYFQRYNYLKDDYKEKREAYEQQLTATQKIRAYFDLWLPARNDSINWRTVFFATQEEYTESTPKERLERINTWYTTECDVNAQIAEQKEKLRTLSFIFENAQSFVKFKVQFNEIVAYINLLLPENEKLTDNDTANYLIAALKRCPDFKRQVEFTGEMFRYERNHNDHTRHTSEIFEFASQCAIQIPLYRTTSGNGYAHAAAQLEEPRTQARMLAELGTEQGDEDSSSDEPNTVYAVAAKRNNVSGDAKRNRAVNPQAPAVHSQGVTITITASASDPNALQPALARLIAGHPAGGTAPPGARTPPAERMRYCWSCGTTLGDQSHTSRNCPKPRKGHQLTCTYANREQFPGFKIPTPRK